MSIRQTLKPLWHGIKAILWSWQHVLFWIEKLTLPFLRAFRFRYWKARVSKIGEGSQIYGRVTILNPHLLSIGKRATLNEGVIIIGKAEAITIGDDVRISAGAQIIATGLKVFVENGARREHESYCIALGNGVWVGAGAIVTGNVKVGDRAVIAAGAVVRSDVAADTVVGGVPAKLVKSIANN